MLSDKVPDRGRDLPPQKAPPKDPLKIYALVGGVLGILVVCILRNALRLPDLIGPVSLHFSVGDLSLSFGLQDIILGTIMGSAIGAHFGRKAQAKQDLDRFRERQAEKEEKHG
jgi:hypothetical protein